MANFVYSRDFDMQYDFVVGVETEEDVLVIRRAVSMQRQKHSETGKNWLISYIFLGNGLWKFCPLVAVLVFILGCASTSVQPVSQYTGTIPKPDRILVYDFAVSPDQVSLDSGIGPKLADLVKGTPRTEKELEVGRMVANTLAVHLVKEIQDLGLQAERAAGASSEVENTILIKGQFLSIDEGNRTERMVIGLGAGRSEVSTYAQIYELTAEGKRLIREFETTAKSGRKPGMAETIGVGAAAGHAAESIAVGTSVGVASEALGDNVDADTRRTAKELAKELSIFFASQGWISEDKLE